MDVRYSYCCRQDDSILPEWVAPVDAFYTELRVCHKLRKLANGGSDADNNEVTLGTRRDIIGMPRARFIAGDFLRLCMKLYLKSAYIPDDSVKESIIDEVHRVGCSMLDLDLKPFPLLVEVGISMLQKPGESEDEGIDRAVKEMDVWDYVPATDESVVRLRQVTFEHGKWSDEYCKHCKKTLACGRLARMPCSHVFHRQCINEWLSCCHWCPICRFSMPADLNRELL